MKFDGNDYEWAYVDLAILGFPHEIHIQGCFLSDFIGTSVIIMVFVYNSFASFVFSKLNNVNMELNSAI